MSGGSVGVYIHGDGTITNYGAITASGFAGINLGTGLITNQGSAVIQGYDGITLGAGTVVNDGTIMSTGAGAQYAGVVAGSTGFFLNDEMDDFTSKPGVPNLYGLVQGAPNAIAPGKRPLSSMTPTIVTQNGALRMVTGSPGGSRIITIVLATMLNALIYGMSA